MLPPEMSGLLSSVYIQRVFELAIDRHYFKEVFPRGDVMLHVFADASIKAYGAVAFLTSGSKRILLPP